MSSTINWPDPDHPGVPHSPDKTGPHLLRNPQGGRVWGWWNAHARSWVAGNQLFGPGFIAEKWTYIGEAVSPDGAPV